MKLHYKKEHISCTNYKVNRMRDSGLERLQAAVTSIVRPYLLKLIS